MRRVPVSMVSVMVLGLVVALGGLAWTSTGNAQPLGKMDRLEQRITALENEIARLRRTPTAKPARQPKSTGVLQVEKIEIINKKGQAVCKIDGDNRSGGGRFRLFDHQGKLTMLTHCDDTGGTIVLFNPRGKIKRKVD